MASNHSAANSVRNFLTKLGKPVAKPNAQRTIAKTIADAFNIGEASPEFQLLLYMQADNFSRLNSQIELSNIGSEAKKSYKSQVLELAQIVRFEFLPQQYDSFRKDVIVPNISALTYLDDALKLTANLDDAAEVEIAEIITHMESAQEDICKSALPLKVRATLHAQISRLIFLLKNYNVAGFEQIWEQTSATYATLCREAPTVTGEKETAAFGRLAFKLSALVGILTIANTGLAQIDSGVQHTLSIGKYLKDGYDRVELWKQKQVPRLEDHRTKDEKKVE